MKKSLASVGLLSIIALGVIAVSPSAVKAEVVEGQEKSTPVNVTITEGTELTLTQVPDKYNLTYGLKSGGSYLIKDANHTPTENKNVEVFNAKIKQAWSVKATVEGKVLTRKSDNKTYTVTKFKINETDILETGATGAIFTSADNSNTGQLSSPITSVAIEFSDDDNNLNIADEITGTISYQLYNTVNAS